MGKEKLLKDVGSQDNVHFPKLRKAMVMGLDLGVDSHSWSLALEGKVQPFVAFGCIQLDLCGVPSIFG